VTAVEPVMRACSGTWIAHGGGSADRQVVDRHDCIAVPPGSDTYTLRRLWLTPEEEKGYYYGFANEGLWPLCHVAHVRPVFRENDWDCYRLVNQRFADAVVEQARSEDPVVLVQDYHFALLPALVRQRAPTRDHPDFLAHPLAESRVFRHLSVAPGDPPGNAWQHDPRLSHALSLQELHRDGRSISGSAYRA
jgi:trehalose-6-phosphate synthase